MRSKKAYRVEIRVSLETKMAWHDAVAKARKMGWDAETLLRKMIELFNEWYGEGKVY